MCVCENKLVEGPHQLRDTNFERACNGDNIAQANLTRSPLNMRNMHLSHP
jgi:hypothetical protein